MTSARSRVRACALTTLLLAAVPGHGEAPHDPGGIVERFYASLAAGDASAAADLLAADAIVLEGGHLESRDEYVAQHLAADIAFARTTTQARSGVRVVVKGDVAWVSARTRTEGAFRGRAVRSEGAELVVLARGSEGWRIRAIHWSAYSTKPSLPNDPRNP